MNIEIISKFINTTGLLFDIFGAWFVASEVVDQFKGEKTIISEGTVIDKPRQKGFSSIPVPKSKIVIGQLSKDSSPFKRWEEKKHRKMWLGLTFLTIGFLLQILSNWTYLILPSNETKKTIEAIIIKEKPIITKILDSKIPPIGQRKPPTNNKKTDK